ncbi:MAG: hypothetical protein Q8O35_04280 [Humidesulfovibrio sp.]|uniref:hypothetical protein n=1 Tax=Humidesulfovibrio sp. TaxID=2910988 RepID=UPI002732DA9B|nr:hypothetical protein [Humidesulfovibrio sp.]MDP2847391.1 hypothetical protein [Humidesulfovibrio sp.]
MESERFIDGVTQIGFGAGMVRIDLGTLSTDKKDESGEPALETRERLVMRPEAFLQMLIAFDHMAKRLADANILPQNPAAQGQ